MDNEIMGKNKATHKRISYSTTRLNCKFIMDIKGSAHSKNENLYFLAPAQTKRMQPILLTCEAPFKSNLQINTGPVRDVV